MTAVAARPAATRSTSWVPVSWALAKRSMAGILRIPAAVVPLVAMPMFFVIAFSGSFSSLADIPGFPTDNVFNWFVPFAILQGAAFAGFGTGFSTVRDIEGGFYDRLLLAPGSRTPLFVGPIIASIARCTFTLVVVLALGLVLGVDMTDALPGLFDAVGGGRGRRRPRHRLGARPGVPGPQLRAPARSSRSASSSPPSCPPATCPSRPRSAGPSPSPPSTRSRPSSQLARQGFLGQVAWSTTWPGLLAIAGSIAVLGIWAVTGLKRLIP